jgi:hypothetical protein
LPDNSHDDFHLTNNEDERRVSIKAAENALDAE